MAVIAVYSVKGGVGKTTIAVDLAWRCAQLGKRETLLWDLDPQSGSAFMLNHRVVRATHAMGVFQRPGKPSDLIAPTAYERLSLLPADATLRDMPLQLARMGNRRRLAKLTRRLESHFDRIVLDCPPMTNEVSEQIIAAADIIILPLPPSPLSVRAMDQVRNELARHSQHPPLLPVLSMYDGRRKLHRAARASFARDWPLVPASTWAEQAAARQAPLPTFAAWSDTSRCLERIWRATEAKLARLGRSDNPFTLVQRAY